LHGILPYIGITRWTWFINIGFYILVINTHCFELQNRRLGVVRPALAHPQIGKPISVSVEIALRACERAKLRARDDSKVAGPGRDNLWGPSVRPYLHRAIFDKKFEQ